MCECLAEIGRSRIKNARFLYELHDLGPLMHPYTQVQSERNEACEVPVLVGPQCLI